MTPKINILQRVGIWIWQGVNGGAYIALNISALLQEINEVVKIFGGLVIIGSGCTAWYFTVKKNKPIKKKKR